MRHLSTLAILLLFAVSADIRAADDPAAVVRALEMRRLEAMIDVDTVFLDHVLSDDLVYTHSNGTTQSKTELMDALVLQRFDYRSIVPQEWVVRVYGDAAIITGAVELEIVVGKNTIRTSLLFTDVYVREGDDWRLVAYQSTRATADK